MIVAESNVIRELDISWNVLKPQSYNTLIESLGSNKTLVSLNLSWNRIVDQKETIIEDSPSGTSPSAAKAGKSSAMSTAKNTKQNTPKYRNSGNIETGLLTLPDEEETPWYEKKVEFTEFTQKVIENLIFLLKRNKRLQLVNLSNTGLTEYMLLQIAS